MTPGELFLNAMRNLSTWDERPQAYQDKKLDLLFAESVYGGLTDDERAKHDQQMTTEYEYLDGIRVEKEGSDSTKLEIAAKMKAAGMDPADISDYTKLPVESVVSL